MQKTLLSIIFFINLAGVTCFGQELDSKVDLLILPPYSEIKVITKGNKLQIDTPLTHQVQKEIINLAITLIPDSIATTLFTSNESQLSDIYKSISKILQTAEFKFKAKKIKAPDLLIHLLDSTQNDFALGIVNVGFVRTAANQTSEYTKSMGLNFFSLGIYNFVPIESSSTMACFIIDRKLKTVQFYKKSIWSERNPTETIVIKSQLHHLLMEYFLARK